MLLQSYWKYSLVQSRSLHLSCIFTGNEPAVTEHGCSSQDLFSTCYKCYAGLLFKNQKILFPLLFQKPTRILNDQVIYSQLCYFYDIPCFVLLVIKRLDLLKAQRRKREHTGGGDLELLGKRLKEHYRWLLSFQSPIFSSVLTYW